MQYKNQDAIGGKAIVEKYDGKVLVGKVDVDSEKITVTSLDRNNAELDRIEITEDGSVKELYRSEDMKYYEY